MKGSELFSFGRGGGFVEDAISYEIGICHLFSGLKVDIHCEGKPVR